MFPSFSKQMSQISTQISSGATVHLSWNIIGGYEKNCTIAELYNGINSVCVEVLRPSQPNGVMSSAVSLPNHTFTGQA